MCHTQPNACFPTPAPRGRVTTEVEAMIFGDGHAERRIAILPDIYGQTPFYQGLATRLAEKGAQVFLVDPFAGLGELPEATREAAFERRNRLADKAFLDAFETFCNRSDVDSIIGFCLGGYYVFELAHRKVPQTLVGFYGFPQGMPNRDPLPIPFDYLGDLDKPHTSLMPVDDQVVGPDNVARLVDVARDNPTLDLQVYPGSGHGFLKDLESGESTLRANAEQALAHCEATLALPA